MPQLVFNMKEKNGPILKFNGQPSKHQPYLARSDPHRLHPIMTRILKKFFGTEIIHQREGTSSDLKHKARMDQKPLFFKSLGCFTVPLCDFAERGRGMKIAFKKHIWCVVSIMCLQKKHVYNSICLVCFLPLLKEITNKIADPKQEQLNTWYIIRFERTPRVRLAANKTSCVNTGYAHSKSNNHH